MKIIICGAGQVGTHVAEAMASGGNSITVIDTDQARLRAIADSMDVATLWGNGAEAGVLREAGCERANLLVAATDRDEVNLLAAAVGRKVGAGKTIARVHHGSYFENQGLDYEKEFGIDRLICPEYSTAQAIASTLRNPGTLAIENFARGSIMMQQFPVADDAAALGKTLQDLGVKPGVRVAAITRGGQAFIPDAGTRVERGDMVVLVANQATFQEARRLFHDDKLGRRRVVLMGGTAMAVWLCRFLNDRNFTVRLFETDRLRAQELAEQLDWVTVIQASPTDRSVAEEEHLGQADVFVALRSADEDNVIASVLAKAMGVTQVIAVVQGSAYLDLVYHIGVDRAFNPSVVAATEIRRTLEEGPCQQLSSLADGAVDAYQVSVDSGAEVVGRRLREMKLSPNWIVAGVRRGERAWVPGPDDMIEGGDVALLVGRHGTEKELRRFYLGRRNA